MTEPTPNAPEPTAEGPAQGLTQSSWDDLFKGEDPAKVRKALDESRKWEQRAKDNNKAREELERQRQQSMTEAERAVAEAEQRGRSAVLVEFGQKLARSAFVAEAARRNPGFDAQAVLDDLNLARYVGDDGEPDSKAIAAAVERLVPALTEQAPTVPSFDGGTRSATPLALNGDPLLNALKSKLGI